MTIPAKTIRSASAFTLVELMVAIGLAGIIMAALMYSFIFCSRSFVAIGNYMDLDRASLETLDTMSKDIRQATSLQSFANNQLVFTDVNTNLLTYAWDSGSGLFTRSSGGTSTVLLKGCDYLDFDIFTKAPLKNGTFGFNTATNNASLCKLVNVTWRCSRTIIGLKVNTESVQTAQIVLRN
jgi:prepilin-type N-terminal cleavage/methylation domain-containing protein